MKRTFLFFATALMLGMAMPTMAQQKKAPMKRTTTTKSGTAAKKSTAPTVINFTARGELGLFALRGPVKECVWKTKDGTRKLGFDKKGMWTSEDGRLPWANYGSVKRDSKGRIIQMGEDVESGEQFTYNSNGLMIKHVTIYMDGRDIATYTYNSKGECTKEIFSYGDMYGSGKNTAIFTILTRDSQGNWTKRKTHNGNVETRTITYYEDTTAPKPQGGTTPTPQNNPTPVPTPKPQTAVIPTSKAVEGIDIVAYGYNLVKPGDYEKAKQTMSSLPEPTTKDDLFTVKYDRVHTMALHKFKPSDGLKLGVSMDVSQLNYADINYELIKLGFQFVEVESPEAAKKIYKYNDGKGCFVTLSIETGADTFIILNFGK